MGFLKYVMYGVRQIQYDYLRQPRVKGLIGEQQVRNTLKTQRLIINDLTTNEPHKAQIDHIVINEKGVLVIETKNYSGIIRGRAHDRFWYQYVGDKKNAFLNPLIQNQYHIDCLINIFPEYSESFRSIVVFTDKAKLYISGISNVTKLSMLNKHIESMNDAGLPVELREPLFQRIKLIKETNAS